MAVPFTLPSQQQTGLLPFCACTLPSLPPFPAGRPLVASFAVAFQAFIHANLVQHERSLDQRD